jgi:hypothetical protein
LDNNANNSNGPLEKFTKNKWIVLLTGIAAIVLAVLAFSNKFADEWTKFAAHFHSNATVTKTEPDPTTIKPTHAPTPEPVSEAPLQITSTPLVIDFTPRQFGGSRPGCDCNSSDIVFPSGSIQGKPNQELKFQWDAAPICHGQAFENFNGHIFVGGQSLQLPNNNNNSQFPGIAGTMNLKFSKPHVGEAAVDIFLNCVDKGAANCSRGCQAHGDVEVHVQ